MNLLELQHIRNVSQAVLHSCDLFFKRLQPKGLHTCCWRGHGQPMVILVYTRCASIFVARKHRPLRSEVLHAMIFSERFATNRFAVGCEMTKEFWKLVAVLLSTLIGQRVRSVKFVNGKNYISSTKSPILMRFELFASATHQK